VNHCLNLLKKEGGKQSQSIDDESSGVLKKLQVSPIGDRNLDIQMGVTQTGIARIRESGR